MKKADIKVGGHYRAKVNGRLTTVRVDAISDSSWAATGHGSVSYDVTNLTTGRQTTFRSAQKFVAPANMEPKWVETRNDGTVYDQSDELVPVEEGDDSPLPSDPRDEPCPWCRRHPEECQCADAIFGHGNGG